MAYSRMELDSAADLVFGRSKYPLRYGLEVEIGNGSVVPEIKYSPRPGKEVNLETLKKEYELMTRDILERAVDIGLPAIQLETEHVVQMTDNPRWSAEITSVQKELLEKYHEEYGLRCALRQTIADVRKSEEVMRDGESLHKILEAFEVCAENGADVLSIESLGGKEVFDYAVTRQDIKGILFSLGILAVEDMEFLWKVIANIAKKNGVIAGGDSDCGRSNTAMVLAGGYLNKELPHSVSAVIRAAAGTTCVPPTPS